MDKRRVFRRGDPIADPSGKDPLTWWPFRLSTGRPSAVVNCANGHESSLEDYEILQDGRVRPAFYCAYCEYREHILLDAWPLQASYGDA